MLWPGPVFGAAEQAKEAAHVLAGHAVCAAELDQEERARARFWVVDGREPVEDLADKAGSYTAGGVGDIALQMLQNVGSLLCSRKYGLPFSGQGTLPPA